MGRFRFIVFLSRLSGSRKVLFSFLVKPKLMLEFRACWYAAADGPPPDFQATPSLLASAGVRGGCIPKSSWGPI